MSLKLWFFWMDVFQFVVFLCFWLLIFLNLVFFLCCKLFDWFVCSLHFCVFLKLSLCWNGSLDFLFFFLDALDFQDFLDCLDFVVFLSAEVGRFYAATEFASEGGALPLEGARCEFSTDWVCSICVCICRCERKVYADGLELGVISVKIGISTPKCE